MRQPNLGKLEWLEEEEKKLKQRKKLNEAFKSFVTKILKSGGKL